MLAQFCSRETHARNQRHIKVRNCYARIARISMIFFLNHRQQSTRLSVENLISDGFSNARVHVEIQIPKMTYFSPSITIFALFPGKIMVPLLLATSNYNTHCVVYIRYIIHMYNHRNPFLVIMIKASLSIFTSNYPFNYARKI